MMVSKLRLPRFKQTKEYKEFEEFCKMNGRTQPMRVLMNYCFWTVRTQTFLDDGLRRNRKLKGGET